MNGNLKKLVSFKSNLGIENWISKYNFIFWLYGYLNFYAMSIAETYIFNYIKNIFEKFLRQCKNINFTKIFFILFLFSGYAFAGGLERVNGFMENILTVLRGASMAVVTVAIMWSGYKFLFKQADIAECAKILAGGLLIGGSTELAHHLLGHF